MSGNNGWIGVDFDGTLSEYDHWRGPMHCGAPIKPMVDRVKAWLAAGIEVRIFTARVSTDGSAQRNTDAEDARTMIELWCQSHIGQTLQVTNVKDYAMMELYDDRAVQVEMNTGRIVGHSTRVHA